MVAVGQANVKRRRRDTLQQVLRPLLQLRYVCMLLLTGFCSLLSAPLLQDD